MLKVYHIVISMITILAFLFILTPFYRKKELRKNEIERKYFDLIKAEKSNESISKELMAAAQDNYTKLDETLLKEQIKNDMNMMG